GARGATPPPPRARPGGAPPPHEAAAAALWAAYRRRLADPGVAAATVIANPFARPVQAAAAPWTHRDRRIAQFSPLSPAADFPERLRARIDGAARRNLRKAQEAGITVAVENDAVAFLRACHRAGMAAMGGTPKPEAFFTLLPRCFRPDHDFRLYVARLDGEPVAALLVLYYGRFAEYFIPATVAEHRALQPMAATLWRALCDAAAEGREVWNWGGTWTGQTGVYRFKRKWGAEEAAYDYRVVVRNPALLAQTPAALTAAYPYFYVAPFAALAPPSATPCST
ncbi:MAG: GNAT family N-acetyltransferase, partial [Rhodospirillaceae bacterium]|nr:GNAT family N-acetyltransferase [Rhodospirillaceae bacterium]